MEQEALQNSSRTGKKANPLKIGIVHMGFFYSGGGERVVLEQARRLRQRGHKVKVFSPITRWDKCFPQLLREVNPERFTPNFPFPWPFREASAMIASATLPLGIRRLADSDILLCHSQPSMWIGYRTNKLLGIPYVGYLHQLTTFIHKRPDFGENWATKGDFLLLDGLLGRFGRSVAQKLDYTSHRNASKLIFNSDWTRSRFRQVYGLCGEVCHPSIDLSPPLATSFRQGLITVSRHYPWKRIDLALQVLKRLNDRTLRFLVVGEPTSHTATLKHIANELGISDQVTFTGFVEDDILSRMYANSLAYIQTSICEPFGLSPLEAQHHGTPAVVWGDAGVKETVLNGLSGFHARPYDLDDFTQKVRILLSHDERWSDMSRTAETWANKFTWKKHIDVLEAVLEEQRR